MTKKGLEDLIANSEQELASAGGPWIQAPEKMVNKGHFRENLVDINKLLDYFFSSVN